MDRPRKIMQASPVLESGTIPLRLNDFLIKNPMMLIVEVFVLLMPECSGNLVCMNFNKYRY